jgi:N4-gp56 family major capsid protein
MSITRFRPEIWSAVLLTALERKLVFAGPNVINRDYEGEISQMGDVVHISSISDPTINTYTSGSTLTYEDLSDAGQTMPIDRGKSFSFKVDDIDKRQARGNVMTKAMQRAAYKLALEVDNYVASLYTATTAANAISTTSITTGDLAYTGLINLRTKLSEADVPDEGRYVIIPPWYAGLLLNNDKFVRADASGTTDGLRNGRVGRAAGFDVFESNNVINVTGDDWVVQAGVSGAITFADQIVQTEALRLQTTFADAVRGLHLYGAKVIRPYELATLTASIT